MGTIKRDLMRTQTKVYLPLKVFLNEPMALAKGVTVALAKGVIGVCLVAFPSVEAACISFIFLFGTETPLG